MYNNMPFLKTNIVDKTYNNFTGVLLKDGIKYYLVGGKLHRTTGPAITWTRMADGSAGKELLIEWWYYNDKIHRVDGPAYIIRKYKSDAIIESYWWINNNQLTPEQECVARNIVDNPDWPEKWLFINDPLLAPIIDYSNKVPITEHKIV